MYVCRLRGWLISTQGPLALYLWYTNCCYSMVGLLRINRITVESINMGSLPLKDLYKVSSRLGLDRYWIEDV
jgi:hypothetical protein